MTTSSTTFSWMLDTNILGALIGAKSRRVDDSLAATRPDSACISVVSEGEVLFGLARVPEATRLTSLMSATLARFPILAWTSATAKIYGSLRADLQRQGITLGPLDVMIAAHALEIGATLISDDQAFRLVPGLAVENWLE